MKNLVAFLSPDQETRNALENSLDGFSVIRCENLDALNRHLQKNESIAAIVLHINKESELSTFEFLKTGYSEIPRLALLGAKTEFAFDPKSERYAVSGSVAEKDGVDGLAALIRILAVTEMPEVPTTSKENYLQLYGAISRELARIQQEFTVTGMRTLPQNNIASDTQERLAASLSLLKGITINP